MHNAQRRESMTSNHVYLVAAKRTPIGAFQGALASLSAPKLGAASIEAAVTQAKLEPQQIEEVFMGNVLSAEIGRAHV